MGGKLGIIAGLGVGNMAALEAAEGQAKAPHRLHVPAEEEPHELTFMQWPVNRSVYPDGSFLAVLQQTIADIANAISEFEPVVMLAAAAHHNRARRKLSGRVELWDVATDDLWCRDSGPLIAKAANGQRVVCHLKFNGWGAKQQHKNDGRIAARIADRLSMPLVASGLIGEAGGVEHDGQGLLMAHESSWLNANRNPGLSRSQIEARLLAAYGTEQMIWAPGVWGEDITDYHIDSLARFTGPGRVLVNLPDAPMMSDPFHKAALETHAALVKAGLVVTVIPEPEVRRVESKDFVASYANFYVCNAAVIAAEFGDPTADAVAVAALQRHYPGRQVVTLNVDALGEVGGGIHCSTQQPPQA